MNFLNQLSQLLSSDNIYFVILVIVAFGFFYITNQIFSIRKLNLEHKGKRLEEVKQFLETLSSNYDLLTEEAFYLSYGFNLQKREIDYIFAKKNQRKLLFDIKLGKPLISFSPENNAYFYEKKFNLKARVGIQATIYWFSAFMIFLTLVLIFKQNTYSLLAILGIFIIMAYLSFNELRSIYAAERVIANKVFS